MNTHPRNVIRTYMNMEWMFKSRFKITNYIVGKFYIEFALQEMEKEIKNTTTILEEH